MFLCYCPLYRGVPLKVNDFRVCKLGIQSATYKSAVVSASLKIFISVYMEDIVPGSVGHVYERFDVLLIVKYMVKCVHSRTILHIVVTPQHNINIISSLPS